MTDPIRVHPFARASYARTSGSNRATATDNIRVLPNRAFTKEVQ